MSRKRLSRRQGHLQSLIRNQVASLFLHGKIHTTDAKARQIAPVAEKMITLGKQGDLAARRQAAAYLNHPEAVKKLFEEVAPKYKDRDGGYTRILRIGVRRGDAATISRVELV